MNEERIRALMAEHDQLWLESKPLYDRIEAVSERLFNIQKMIRDEDPDCNLWQCVVRRRFLFLCWWAKKDGPFWLDNDGFHPIAGSERRSGNDRRNHGR